MDALDIFGDFGYQKCAKILLFLDKFGQISGS